MLKPFPRLALFVPAVLLSVVFPVYNLTWTRLPTECEVFDSAVWLAVTPLVVVVVLVPMSIITEKSRNYQTALVVSLISIFTIIVGFANVYAGAGVQHQGSLPTHWVDYVYFSATTFTTLGYGDFIPCPQVRLFTSLEALLGLLYGPLLVGLSVNKFIGLRGRS